MGVGPWIAGAMKPWGQEQLRAYGTVGVSPSHGARGPVRESGGRALKTQLRAAGAMKPWGQRAMAEWAVRVGGVEEAGMHWPEGHGERSEWGERAGGVEEAGMHWSPCAGALETLG